MKITAVLCVLIILTGCGGMYTWTLDEIRAKPAEQIEIKKDAFCVYTTLHRTLITNYGESPTHLVFLKWDAYWDTTKRRGEIFATEQGPYGEYPLHFTIYAVPEKTIIEKRTSLYAGTDWTWKEMIEKILHETDYSECSAP